MVWACAYLCHQCLALVASVNSVNSVSPGHFMIGGEESRDNMYSIQDHRRRSRKGYGDQFPHFEIWGGDNPPAFQARLRAELFSNVQHFFFSLSK